MLSHRLRAAAAAALTIAGLTLPATALTAPAHAIPVRCATERAAVTDANQAATTARGNLADAKTALADAVAARKANPNPETRKGYTDALAARTAARGALNEAVQAVKDAIAARNACLNPTGPVTFSGGESRLSGIEWLISAIHVSGFAPEQKFELVITAELRNGGGTMPVSQETERADATGAYIVGSFLVGCDERVPAASSAIIFSVLNSATGITRGSIRVPNPCPSPSA